MEKRLSISSTSALIAGGGLALIPLLFLPITQDFFSYNKFIFLILLTLVLMIMWSIGVIRNKRIFFSYSKPVVAFSAMTLAALISLIFSSSNRVEALLSVHGILTYASLTILLSLTLPVFTTAIRRKVRWIAFSIGGFLSVFALYQWLGLSNKLLPSVEFLQDPLWTPIGSPTNLLVYLVVLAPLVSIELYAAIKKKNEMKIGVSALLLILFLTGFIITLVQFIPHIPVAFLPYTTAWEIVFGVLSTLRFAFTGVGAENFLYAFTSARSIAYNQSTTWNIQFATSAAYILHIATIFGFLGLIASIMIIRSLIPSKQSIRHMSRYLSIAVLLLIPPSFTLITTVVLILILTHSEEEEQHLSLSVPHEAPWIRYILAGLTVLTAMIAGIGVIRAHAAERVFYRSLNPELQSDGNQVYQMQLQSIQLMPGIAKYRAQFSRTNLALANAIVDEVRARAEENAGDDSDTLNEEERGMVTQLIQQAIDEAKQAANLAPRNVTSWGNLASVYQALIGIAESSDQWAIASYNQAITTDPNNPILHLNLGGVYVRQQSYEQAINQFSIAIQLKKDLANSYYNLSNAYKLMGDIDRAIAAMEQAVALVPPGTPDHTKATEELASLRATPQDDTPPARQQRNESEEESDADETSSLFENVAPEATTEGDVVLPQIELEDDDTLGISDEATSGASPSQ